MPTDQVYRKSGSPQASTEVSSLQLNRTKNKEALEKSLKSRRSVKELVNQGILLNPSISHPDKVRQLQRAKTSDLLKRKIEQRPDRQYLISHHILRDDKPGTSPFILEQCHNLEKSQLKETLATKLISRPGSLELVEKGVLQVDPGVDSLIRQGSIQYPRVEPTFSDKSSNDRLQPIQELTNIPPPPPLSLSTKVHTNSGRVASGRSRLNSSSKSSSSRAIRDDTVVSKLGSLVFHQYCPDSSSSSSPSLSNISSFQQKQRVRELQQAEMLRLQDTARAHRLVEQELCQRVGIGCEKPSKDDVSVDFTSDVSLDDQTDSQPALPYKPNLISMQVTQPVSNGLRTNTSKVPSLDLNFSSPSLTHLTLAQLKGECKERNLPRVGSKMQLMRLLNPYRHEILVKYFPDYVVPNNEEIKTDLNESCQPSNHDVIQTEAFFQNPDSCLQQELGLQQTLMVNHDQQLMRVNFQDFDSSLLPHTKPLGMCTSVFSSGSNLPKDVQVYSDMVIGTNCSNVLIAQPCVPLRHSVSAPFFSEVASNSSSTHTTHFQIPSTQGNISSTTLIPVTFLDSSVSESDRDFQIPVSSVGGLQLAGTTEKQSFVCMTPNSYLDAQVSNAQFSSNSGNSLFHPLMTSHIYESNFVTSSHQNFPISNSIDSLSSCNETHNPHAIPAQSSSDNQIPVYSHLNGGCSASPQLTTLHQIEEMWLRIRQLRRNIAQVKTSQCVLNDTENSSNSGNLAHLQQEHNRLAVLCRLLIIERLDTLDEINADDSKNSHESNSSDFKIERDLLNSYLRRLGGSTLANSISSSNTETASFNSSSSLPVKSISNTPCYVPCTLPMQQQQQQQQQSTVGHSDAYPMTPESTRYEDHGNNELVKVTAASSDFNDNNGEGINSDPSEILFNCGQLNAGKQNSSESQSSPVSRLLKTHTYDDTPLEQLPSPMTTDLLFELWNSVVEDNNNNADQWKTNTTADSSDVNMTEEVSQRNNGLSSSSDPLLLTACETPTNNSASTPITAVTNNSRDSSGFNSFSKSDIQSM
uniref:SAP domain-containing protein n=1 Tax=Trichobilharzia regenti TaxID=157069 RepID=A0AA85JKJ3_TRIRE|nr:unnamed protein product [Trichobilharzia regenti]